MIKNIPLNLITFFDFALSELCFFSCQKSTFGIIQWTFLIMILLKLNWIFLCLSFFLFLLLLIKINTSEVLLLKGKL